MTKAKAKAIKPAKKQSMTRKRSTKKSVERSYVEPKTAAELNIICGAMLDGGKCSKPVLWFDYAIGEKDYIAGFVCDEHRVSNRVEKLAVKEQHQAKTA